MALKRNETYPGRFSNPTSDHPQGAFKNRSAPGAQDGSFCEQQWANDWDGFFGRLLTVAGIAPDGNVDTASTSQYYDALKSLFLQRANPFADIKVDGAVNTALANLGLGGAATRDVGTTAGTVAAGDDNRITGAMQKSNNGSDIANKKSFLNNIGITSGTGWLTIADHIIQYGTHTQTENTTFNISFPIPFPNTCLNVVMTRIANTASPTGSVYNPTSTGFILKQADGGNGGSFWIAIGK